MQTLIIASKSKQGLLAVANSANTSSARREKGGIGDKIALLVHLGACWRLQTSANASWTRGVPGVEEGVKSINALVNVRTGLVGACKQALTLLGPEVKEGVN